MARPPSDSRPLPVPSSRISRLTRLSTMTAGVAGNMALRGAAELGRGKRPKFRDLLMTPANMSRVADQLAKMRGAAMKVGQLVSMDTGDVLPPELADIFARLRDDAHFMPPAQLKKVLATHWPKGWLGQFQSFDVRPIAAASIGQVHRAQTSDGRDMAIKVQYPGVAQSIDSDVANVGALVRMSGLLPKGFELAPYLEEARKQLHDETDYALEGEYLREFGGLLAGDNRYIVPTLHEDWTTPGILAMSFIKGDPIEAAAQAPEPMRNAIAHAVIELLLRELFEFGVMQTDPNFANYRYDPATGQIILLDFGATRRLGPEIVAQYRRLMRAGLDADHAAMDAICLEIGFYQPETALAHRDQILRMMDIVFAPLRSDTPFDMADSVMPRRMQEEGRALAAAGFIPPPLPIDALFLQRKFGGIFLLCAKLRATVAVRELLERFV